MGCPPTPFVLASCPCDWWARHSLAVLLLLLCQWQWPRVQVLLLAVGQWALGPALGQQ